MIIWTFFNQLIQFYHRLRGSAMQPCVNSDWLCQWEMAIFDPHRIHTPWQITKKLLLLITTATPTDMPNLVQIRPRGASAQMGKI